MAVNRSDGQVYVTDSGNNRVNVFDEDGVFLSFFGSPGAGEGQFVNPRKVAVDNDSSSPNFGDVFVTDATPRVQRFNSAGVFEATIGVGQLNTSNPPISVVEGGDLYVVDSTGPEPSEPLEVKIFSSTGTLVGSSTLDVDSLRSAVSDSDGTTYVTTFSNGERTLKYEPTEPTATLLASFDALANTTALAVDEEENLYSAQRDEVFRRVITKRNPNGTILKRFGYGEISFESIEGLDVGATGDLFGSRTSFNEIEGDNVVRIPQPLPGPLPCCLTVVPGNTKATLKGQVNPEGAATSYHFQYLTEADFVANGNSFSGPNVPISTPVSGPVGPDFNLHPAEAQIGCATPSDPPQVECLVPETNYRARLVATSADDEGEDNWTEIAFISKDSLEIKDAWSTDVGLSEAEIHAKVNPLGIPAEAFFEYVEDASFQASGFTNATKAPAAPIELGGGEAFVTASSQIVGLKPNTLYHYRVVASNAFVANVLGVEQTLLTFPNPVSIPGCTNDAFRIGVAARLPDCRAYEMVSPIDKSGGDIKVLVQGLSFPARLDQSAESGDAFTYSSVAAFAEPQSALWSSQYLARRGDGGWTTEAINQPKEPTNLVDNPVLKLDVQYRHFSADLSSGWVSQYASPALDECAPQGFINLYRRDSATGIYEALVPAAPANPDNNDPRIELQGLSADETKAFFRANAKLTPDASSVKGINQLYMHTRDTEGGCGKLTLVSRKPNGSAVSVNSTVGSPGGAAEYRQGTVARGVSADGRRVFFSTGAITDTENGPLFVRVNADLPQGPVSGGKCSLPITLGCTLEISAGKAQFWSASKDGSRVVYSVGDELFEYGVEKAMAGEMAQTLIASDAQGVVGVSENAARIYFVSDDQIEGDGMVGQPNLYLYEPAKAAPDRYRLVTTLSQRDLSGPDLFGLAVSTPAPIENGTRLSADGSHLAFVSQASPTGYDNLDAASGEPAIEVYLYDTASEEVRCISCNPSGSRPEGRKFEEGSTIRYVAAMMAPGESQTFAPRSLSADGNRLFFESFDALLPRDVNESMDVYEWQRAPDASACEAKGMELFVPASGGCLSLISSGQDETDSELADASPGGSNVFIRTASSLVPQDPGQVDIYDVREGGGFPPIIRQTPCVGEGCRSQPPPPPPTTGIATQGSSSGNVPAPRPCPKGKARSKKGNCVKKKPKSSKKKGKGTKKKGAKNTKGAGR